MPIVGRFLKLVGKIVLDKIIGQVRTDELTALITEWRADPAQAAVEMAAAKQTIAEPTSFKEMVAESIEEQNRETVSLVLSQAVPDISLDMLGVTGSGRETAPDVVARKFIADALPTPKENTYLLWLEPPHLVEGSVPGYCHFSYVLNEKLGQVTYRIRDYRNGKLYYAVTTPKKDDRWGTPVPWGERFSALQLWQAARARIPARTGYFSIELFEKWKDLLNEKTRTNPPR